MCDYYHLGPDVTPRYQANRDARRAVLLNYSQCSTRQCLLFVPQDVVDMLDKFDDLHEACVSLVAEAHR